MPAMQRERRIYVAGRFRRYEECRALMDDLTDAGYIITHDWTRSDEFDGSGHPHGADEKMGCREQRDYALDDLEGVRTADLLVVLAHDSLCGALIEVGAALASGIPVWVCDPWRHTVFWHHPLVSVMSELDMRKALGLPDNS